MDVESDVGATQDECISLQKAASESLAADWGPIGRLRLVLRSQGTAYECGKSLLSANALFSKGGQSLAAIWGEERAQVKRSEFFEQTLKRLFTHPQHFNDKAVWLLLQALLSAQQMFTSKSCAVDAIEETLSGELIGLITGRADDWKQRGLAVLQRTGSDLTMSKVELQVVGPNPLVHQAASLL